MIGGSATVNGPVAAGLYAHAEQHRSDPDDAVRRELAALRDQARAHRAELDEPDFVAADIDEVTQEAAKPRLDRDRISAALNRLAGRVAAVTALATAVEQLRELILR